MDFQGFHLTVSHLKPNVPWNNEKASERQVHFLSQCFTGKRECNCTVNSTTATKDSFIKTHL